MGSNNKTAVVNKEHLLIEQLKSGSYKAFTELYKMYYHLLYGYIFGLTRSHQQTKDIAQSVFLKVWISRTTLDTSYSFKAWLYKIAKNQLIDELRKQFSDQLFEDYLNYCENEDLIVEPNEDSFDFDQFMEQLKKAKSKLSPRQKEVFELCKEAGYSASEVADKLNITEQSVYNYLSQSLHILKKEITPYYILFVLFFIS